MKKRLIIALIIIILSSGMFCFLKFHLSKKDIVAPQIGPLEKCESISADTEELPEEYLELIEYARDYCYTEEAVDRQDESYCSQVSSQGKYSLRDSCYSKVAEAKGDQKVCIYIKEQKAMDYCYFQVAKIKQDPIICRYLKDELMEKVCLAYTQNPSLCEELDNIKGMTEVLGLSRPTDYCYLHWAIAEKNLNFCDKIKLIGPCYLDFAVKTLDPSICELPQLKNNVNIYACYARIVEAQPDEQKDVNLCKKISPEGHNSTLNYNCYQNVAIAKKNPGICNGIAVERISDACKKRVSAIISHPTVCDNLRDPQEKTSCYDKIMREGLLKFDD